MRPTGIHPSAVIGEPPEHREWSVGDPFLYPQIDPSARVNALCTIDSGLREPTRVGARTFVMARCHLGHDSQIGADCELAPGTVIGGHAVLEDGVRCGIGVLVRPFIRVGAGARLGAGAVVVKDVPAGEVWCGNPARKLERREAAALADHISASELHQAALAVLPHLTFHRGQTLTKADEVTLEWVAEVLAKAAHLCEICESPETKGFADKSNIFTDYLCSAHADCAEGSERSFA